MNDIFVEARLRDWDATAEAIAFESRVRQLLAADEAQEKANHMESAGSTNGRRAA